jgi:hypothetical protein
VYHENLMATGVGGVITGAWVRAEERSWQPDLLFFPYESTETVKTWPKISTMIRDDVLVVGTDIEHARTKYFWPDYISNPPKEFLEAEANWNDKWKGYVVNYSDYGRVDYVVYLDHSRPRYMVVEMKKHMESALLSFRVASKDKMDLQISDALGRRLFGQGDGYLLWDFLPYEEGTAFQDDALQWNEVDIAIENYLAGLPSATRRGQLDDLISSVER